MEATATSQVRVHDKFYINGRWTQPQGADLIEVINSTTEAIMGKVPEGTAEDINAAVAAARTAFGSWSSTPVETRAAYLDQIAAKLKERQAGIAATIAAEVGMPLPMATAVQAGLAITDVSTTAKLAREFQFEEQVGNALIAKEPIGVVGCITPWNFPLHQITAKVAPALAAGCTVVLKPSEVAPLTAFMLAEIIDEIGLPAGVFNLVTGYGPVVGEALAAHPDVDMISFTGSTHAGKRVSELAAQTVKRVALELGGKSANIILDDADFERAVASGVGNCYFNSGQTCSALTRMLVPKSRYDEAVAIAKRAAEKFTVGDPLGGAAKLGPLVSATQRDRVVGYIEKGIAEGATLVAGGPEKPEGLEPGFFVRPTVFANVDNQMTIAQEEIFGPVLSLIAYEDEDDAVRLANDTVYGLSGGVWSGDPERAKRVARRLRTGQVEINGGRFNPLAPFGGYKQSGNGRELGKFGLEEFLEVKAMLL
ncbi:MAG: aldehyde dehydrogenase family protein [Acidobacteria bacterium]|nr:aldehyde dehydrogenase family protein [Acidobacteriota bacterium]MBI3425320.1 aldehyde dehydrogenase family protein [Acidobacteriota bacterium]